MKKKAHCPEIFLVAASSMLTETAVLFLDVELLSELHDQLPWALGNKFQGLSKEEKENLARQDPRVGEHLEIIRRKEMLELALAKMKRLQFRKGMSSEERMV
jgi:dynamin-like GTPase MGM1, mitochondrial